MLNYANFVKSCQTRLSRYDKQTVEQSLEQKILQDMDEGDLSKNDFKPFLLDVDLVRGSVFGKKKPRQGWALTVIRGFLRSMFAPFYWSYWCQHTSLRLATFIMLHFSIQFLQVLCFLLLDSETSLRYQDDLIVPCLLAVCLGILHTHIVAVHGGSGGTTGAVGDLGRGLLDCRGTTAGTGRPAAVTLLGVDSYDTRKRDSGVATNGPFSVHESQPPQPSANQLHHFSQWKLKVGQRSQQPILGSKLHPDQEDEEEADVEEDDDEGLSDCQQLSSSPLVAAGRNRHVCYNRSLLGADDDDDWVVHKLAVTSRTDDTVYYNLDQQQLSTPSFSQYDPTASTCAAGGIRRRYTHHRVSHRHGHEADSEDSEVEIGSQATRHDQPHDVEANEDLCSVTTRPIVDRFPSASQTTTRLASTESQPSSSLTTASVVNSSQMENQETAVVPVCTAQDCNRVLSVFTGTRTPGNASVDGAAMQSRIFRRAVTDWPFTIIRTSIDRNVSARSWSVDLPICCTRLQLSTTSTTPSTTPSCYSSTLPPLAIQYADRRHRRFYSSSTTGSSGALNQAHQLLPAPVSSQSADTSSGLNRAGVTRWVSEPTLFLPMFNQLGLYRLLPPGASSPATAANFRSPSSSSSSSLCSRATACLPLNCRKECAVSTEGRRNIIEPIEVDDICANPKSPSQQGASVTGNRKVSHGVTNNALVNGVSDHPFISKSLTNLTWTSERLSDTTAVPVLPARDVLTANQTVSSEAVEQQSATNGKAPCEFTDLDPAKNEDTVTVNNRRLNRYLNLFRQRSGNRNLLFTGYQPGHTHSHQQHRGRVITRTRLSRSTTLPDSTVASGGVVLTPTATVPPRMIFIEPAIQQATRAAPFLRSRLNSCGSNGTTGSRGGYNESMVTELRRASYAPRSSKRRHIRTANTMKFCNHLKSGELKRTTLNNRGQTASETEYERINSDIGSEMDSSSGPDGTPADGHCIRQSVPSGASTHATQLQNPDDSLTLAAIPKQQQPPPRNLSVVSTSSSASSSVRLHTIVDTDAGAFDVDLDVDSLRQILAEDKLTALRQPADVSLSNAMAAAEEPLATVVPRPAETLNDDLRNGDDFHRHHQQPAPSSIVNMYPNADGATNEPPFDPIALRYKYEHRQSESLTNQWGQLPFINTDTVRCYVWEGDRMRKLNLSMFDIGWNVVRAVERQGVSSDYVMIGCVASLLMSLLSVVFHWDALVGLWPDVNFTLVPVENVTTLSTGLLGGSSSLLGIQVSALVHLLQMVVAVAVGRPLRWLIWLVTTLVQTSLKDWSRIGWSLLSGRWLFTWLSVAELPSGIFVLLGVPIRLGVYGVVFLLLSIAEQTFQQRLLYAKYFFSLTSSRRARKYRLPHFRLNKLRHIKCWLTLRSYLKKRGPQRSVEHIIAAAFYVIFVLGLVMCSQLISRKEGTFFTQITNWDIVGLTMAITVYLHRLIIVGTKITKQYRNFSIIITEQINLYLCLEKKPHKKDELMSTFQVLRLVEGLIKEVDGPFRVCGWTVNPLVYNIFKLVLLSCFSSLLSQTFGFKLKLYKLKLNAANW